MYYFQVFGYMYTGQGFHGIIIWFTWTEIHTNEWKMILKFLNSCTFWYNMTFFKAEYMFRWIVRHDWQTVIYIIFIVSLNMNNQNVLLVDYLQSPSTYRLLNISNSSAFQQQTLQHLQITNKVSMSVVWSMLFLKCDFRQDLQNNQRNTNVYAMCENGICYSN